MKKIVLAVILFLLMCTNAHALEVIEKEGIFIYFPEGENALASDLSEKLGPIETFLSNYGLKVPRPLHVVIDEKKDFAGVSAYIIPHWEIRIPIKAPGVFDEGYLEEDPWGYFLFKGMCLESVYYTRSGIPDALHYVFGQVSSPNGMMPPWFDEGFSSLMYKLYAGKEVQDPFDRAILLSSVPVDIAKFSNHPGTWPGHYSYRVFGRPFIEWTYMQYGINDLMEFIRLHGNGILPIEVESKARKAFGKPWYELWEEYISEIKPDLGEDGGMFIQGYWPDPFIYWNYSGVHPGTERRIACGRYGFRSEHNTLWIDEYDDEGRSRLVAHRGGITTTTEVKHVWDPGQGNIAVTRKGHVPYLIELKSEKIFGLSSIDKGTEFIQGPPGAIQLSGPVRNKDGRIAVSANIGGNWDIWVFDKDWKRMTDSPSIEADPWWEEGTIIYSSNISGIFQIYAQGMVQLTNEPYAALLPRKGKYLKLVHNGWKVSTYTNLPAAEVAIKSTVEDKIISRETEIVEGRKYNPLKSIMPNWVLPDFYADTTDFQIGLNTFGKDVSRDFGVNAGLRYSFYENYLSARIGGNAKGFGLNLSRYPLDYISDIAAVDESRYEGKVYFNPLEHKWFEISFNWVNWSDRDYGNDSGDDIWGAISLNKIFGSLGTSLSFEQYSGGMSSLYGSVRLKNGVGIYNVASLSAGKTWGDWEPGHGSFRMGGDVGEGYFTRRPSRLYPLRGFTSNAFEASQVYTLSDEVFWPLVNLQKGYKTFPLFLHKLKLGTFVDGGICSEQISSDDIALGAGIELLTSLEIAWGFIMEIRLGAACPVVTPDYVNTSDVVFLFTMGKPL